MQLTLVSIRVRKRVVIICEKEKQAKQVCEHPICLLAVLFQSAAVTVTSTRHRVQVVGAVNNAMMTAALIDNRVQLEY